MNYNTEEEVWKDVKGFEGYYQVSNKGRVKSVDRVVSYENEFGTFDRKIQSRVLTTAETTGYQIVSLYKNKKRKMKYVHRLVAEAFISNPNNLPMINHKDEDKINNIVNNLEWCTAAYNMEYNNLRNRNAVKQRKPVIGKHLETGEIIRYPSVTSATKDGYPSVSFVLRGERKHSGGYTWRYDK